MDEIVMGTSFAEILKSAPLSSDAFVSLSLSPLSPLSISPIYDLLSTSDIPHSEEGLVIMRDILSTLPARNRSVLVYLLRFLQEVASHAEINKFAHLHLYSCIYLFSSLYYYYYLSFYFFLYLYSMHPL